MRRRPATRSEAFDRVNSEGLALTEVTATTRYDGSALRDVLSGSWRLTADKIRKRRQRPALPATAL